MKRFFPELPGRERLAKLGVPDSSEDRAIVSAGYLRLCLQPVAVPVALGDVGEQGPDDTPGTESRTRLAFAAGTLVVLVAAVAGVLLLSGGDERHSFAAAPTRCIDGWNKDQSAIVLGRHQSTYHHYAEVQVLTLSPDGASEAPEGEATAICAVSFAASSLDAELAAAAIIKRPEGWVALSDQVSDPNRLAELQSNAQDDYNATLTPEGTIDPL